MCLTVTGKGTKAIHFQRAVYQFLFRLCNDMHDFALFLNGSICRVVKVVFLCVWVCVCVYVCVCLSLHFALLLVLGGCHSSSSFLTCSFGIESYPIENSRRLFCFTIYF